MTTLDIITSVLVLSGSALGQADRYAVLAAPGACARLEALREAVETVAAMVEFQLSE